MPMNKLTPEIINAAVEGFEQQKQRIDAQIAELRALLTGTPTESAARPETPKGKRKKFSAAARLRMKEAQQRRWAKIHAETEAAAPTPEPKKAKRKLSEAGKANIVAALKKRWAAKKAAAKKTAPVGTKKAAAKKAPMKASRKAAKKGSAKRPQRTAATPAVPVATA